MDEPASGTSQPRVEGQRAGCSPLGIVFGFVLAVPTVFVAGGMSMLGSPDGEFVALFLGAGFVAGCVTGTSIAALGVGLVLGSAVTGSVRAGVAAAILAALGGGAGYAVRAAALLAWRKWRRRTA